MFLLKCIYCAKQINKENRSKEHIIQNALGGLYESTKICCNECNNIVERSIDNSYCSIFSPITTQLPNMKKTNKSAMPSSRGIAIYGGDSRLYEVIIKNKRVIDCIELKRKLKRDLTKKDYKEFKIIYYKFDLTNKIFISGISKIAFNYAIAEDIPFSKIRHNLSVCKDGDIVKEIKFTSQVIPFMPLNYFDTFLELETKMELYHHLILFSFNDYLICYIDLFNTFQFYVVLTDTWDGEVIYKSYFQVLEKIDRTTPEIQVYRPKHIMTLSKIYNITPTYDIERLKKEIKKTIDMLPYEKNMEEYIPKKIHYGYFNNGTGDIIGKAYSLGFYLNEDETLRNNIFRKFTPAIDSYGERLYFFYPDYILKNLETGVNIKEYTYLKFKRLTDYLINK